MHSKTTDGPDRVSSDENPIGQAEGEVFIPGKGFACT